MAECSRWRLIVDVPRNGAWNMAVDEAVLEAVAAGEAPATLRFYAWSPPCISIGYAQKLQDFDLERLRADGVELVRRPSGGRAVLHKQELTYCLCITADDGRVSGGVLASYRRLSWGFMEGLRYLGLDSTLMEGEGGEQAVPAACFNAPSRYELTAAGRKIVGSAQWRHNGGVLQHGSVPLNADVAELVNYMAVSEAERQAAREALRCRAGTLSAALGRPVSFLEVTTALAQGLAEVLELEWLEAELTTAERVRAKMLMREKYGSEAWLHRV